MVFRLIELSDDINNVASNFGKQSALCQVWWYISNGVLFLDSCVKVHDVCEQRWVVETPYRLIMMMDNSWGHYIHTFVRSRLTKFT